MIDIYTDGSASRSMAAATSRGGYGLVVLRDGVLLDTVQENCFNTTNNREELKAVIRAIELARNEYIDECCFIYCDSSYVVNICNDWIHRWAQNNWFNSQGKPVENFDLVRILYDYINIDFPNFQVIKVRGHAGTLGNELADALAKSDFNKITELKRQITAESAEMT